MKYFWKSSTGILSHTNPNSRQCNYQAGEMWTVKNEALYSGKRCNADFTHSNR